MRLDRNGGRRGTAALAATACVVAAIGAVAVRPAHAAPPPPPAPAVVAFGGNHVGQLGTGTDTDSHSPVQVSGLTGGLNGIVAVAPGELYSLALKPDGTVVAWGSNYSYQLGDGTQVDRYTPVPVLGPGGSGVLSGIGCPVAAPASCVPMAAGDSHSLALKPDGTLLAWGNNEFGQLGDGTTLSRSTPVQIMGPGSGIVAIAAGSVHSLALKSDGTVLAWGDNHKGQLGNGTTNTASDANPTPVAVSGLTAVTAIAAGSQHSLALKSDGTVHAWGSNGLGQLGDSGTTFTDSLVPTTVSVLTSVTAISAGTYYNLALKGGVVYAWGSNFFKNLGNPALDAANAFRSSVPAAVVGTGGTGMLSGIAKMTASPLGFHNLAIRANGSVVAWGFNGNGQLGDGTTTNTDVPKVVAGVSGVVAVAASYNDSLILKPSAGPAQIAPPAPLPFPAPATLSRPTPLAPSAVGPPANVPVSNGAIVSYATPVIAADPTRPGHLAVAFADGNLSACYVSVSADGGQTWAQRTLVADSGADFPFAAIATDPSHTVLHGCWGPTLAFGPDGTLYYDYTGIDPSFTFNDTAIFLLASKDDGATFKAPKQFDTDAPPSTDPTFGNGDSATFADPVMAFDLTSGPTHGQMYLAFSRSGAGFAGQIRLTACTAAQLAAFAATDTLACNPSTLVDPGDRAFAFLIAVPAVGVDGTVSVLWQGQLAALFSDVTNPQIDQVASSTNHGLTFGAASTVDNGYNMCPQGACLGGGSGPQNGKMSIAAGTTPGVLYVAVSGRRGEGFARAAVSVSHDNGATWSSRQEIGRIAGMDNHRQHEAQVAVAPNGQVSIVYYDVAPDATQNVYLITSTDGGATYSAPRKLTDAGSNENIGLNGFPVYDEVLSLVATNARSYVAWGDSRRGTLDSSKTDVFFAQVAGLSTPAPPPAPPQFPKTGEGARVRADLSVTWPAVWAALVLGGVGLVGRRGSRQRAKP